MSGQLPDLHAIDPHRLRWLVYHDTVQRLGDALAGGLTSGQCERIRRDLIPGGIFGPNAIAPEDEPYRARLLDLVCAVLARYHKAPDYPPQEDR